MREGLGQLAVTVLRQNVLSLSRAWTALLTGPRRGEVARKPTHTHKKKEGPFYPKYPERPNLGSLKTLEYLKYLKHN